MYDEKATHDTHDMRPFFNDIYPQDKVCYKCSRCSCHNSSEIEAPCEENVSGPEGLSDMGKTEDPWDKLRKSVKEPDACSYSGCNYKIKGAKRYKFHLALKHPKGRKSG